MCECMCIGTALMAGRQRGQQGRGSKDSWTDAYCAAFEHLFQTDNFTINWTKAEWGVPISVFAAGCGVLLHALIEHKTDNSDRRI